MFILSTVAKGRAPLGGCVRIPSRRVSLQSPRARKQPRPNTDDALFNHLISAQQNRWGYRKTERLSGLEVHGHLKFCRQLNGIDARCVSRNASGTTTRPPPGSRPRATIAISISTSL